MSAQRGDAGMANFSYLKSTFPMSRHTTSYAELEGVEVKISDRYRYCNITFIHQVELMCMTLRDLTKLQEKYDYSFHREHEVLQNFDMEKLIQPTA